MHLSAAPCCSSVCCPCSPCVSGPTGATGPSGLAPSHYFSVSSLSPAPIFFELTTSATNIPFNTFISSSSDQAFELQNSAFVVPASGLYRFEWLLLFFWFPPTVINNTAFVTLAVNDVPTSVSSNSWPIVATEGMFSTLYSFYEGFFEVGSRVTLTGRITDATGAKVNIATTRRLPYSNLFSCRSLF